MAIQGNLSAGVQELAASNGDKSLHNIAFRTAITGFSLFNTTAVNVVVEIYESPNGTSASGEQVAQYTMAPDSSVDVVECIGQGYAASIQIIAKITTAGINAGDVTGKVTYTRYTGAS